MSRWHQDNIWKLLWVFKCLSLFKTQNKMVNITTYHVGGGFISSLALAIFFCLSKWNCGLLCFKQGKTVAKNYICKQWKCQTARILLEVYFSPVKGEKKKNSTETFLSSHQHLYFLCLAGAVATSAGVRLSACATSPPAITWPWPRTVVCSCRTGRSLTLEPPHSASGPLRSVVSIPKYKPNLLLLFLHPALTGPSREGLATSENRPRVLM